MPWCLVSCCNLIRSHLTHNISSFAQDSKFLLRLQSTEVPIEDTLVWKPVGGRTLPSPPHFFFRLRQRQDERKVKLSCLPFFPLKEKSHFSTKVKM